MHRCHWHQNQSRPLPSQHLGTSKIVSSNPFFCLLMLPIPQGMCVNPGERMVFSAFGDSEDNVLLQATIFSSDLHGCVPNGTPE